MVILGHRGAAGEAPENTCTGFAYARSIGVRDYELDIHLTLDGQLAVIHDGDVARTTNGTGIVEEMTMAQLQALDAYAKFPDWPERPFIPTLDEVFDVISDARSIEVEIKKTNPDCYLPILDRLIPIMERYGLTDRITITSFEALALQRARDVAPEIKRGLIGNYDKEEHVKMASDLGCTNAGTYIKTSSKAIISKLHQEGILASGWQGDDEQSLDLLMDWGVDTITTNYPTQAMNYLGNRLS